MRDLPRYHRRHRVECRGDRSNHRQPPDRGGDSWDVHGLDRRTVLAASGAIGAAALAGCSLPGGERPEAVAITESAQCDVCGMVISQHPGPNGQIFFEDNAPEGHDNPARFDALKQCLFPYLFQHHEMDWTARAIYVTDYSSVDYDVQDEGGTLLVSSHPEAAAFATAEDLHYVVGSDVEGAMGPDFVPFSVEADATSFADEYGGEVLTFSEIDEGVVGR